MSISPTLMYKYQDFAIRGYHKLDQSPWQTGSSNNGTGSRGRMFAMYGGKQGVIDLFIAQYAMDNLHFGSSEAKYFNSDRKVFAEVRRTCARSLHYRTGEMISELEESLRDEAWSYGWDARESERKAAMVDLARSVATIKEWEAVEALASVGYAEASTMLGFDPRSSTLASRIIRLRRRLERMVEDADA